MRQSCLIGDQLENLIPDKNPSSYCMDHKIIPDFQNSIQAQDLYTLIEFYDFVYPVYCVVNVGCWKVQATGRSLYGFGG